jgi:hypothetical protein
VIYAKILANQPAQTHYSGRLKPSHPGLTYFSFSLFTTDVEQDCINLLIREFELEELQKNSIQLVQLLYASILQHHCIIKTVGQGHAYG